MIPSGFGQWSSFPNKRPIVLNEEIQLKKTKEHGK